MCSYLMAMVPTTAVLGASPQTDRYSYLAYRTLSEQGRPFALVNPRYAQIDGQAVYPSLAEVPGTVDTVSVYLAPHNQGGLEAELTALGPRRVIFNPGAENPALAAELTRRGIQCLEACTLVLLRTGQF